MKSSKLRLGELLISHGLLAPWQVEQALQEQLRTKEFLGSLLVRKQWVTEETLLRTLAEQFGIPYVHLMEEMVNWRVAGRFSHTMMLEHLCVPIQMDAHSLTAAIANPLDAWIVSELERLAGARKVHLVLALAQDIRAIIRRAHQEALNHLEEAMRDADAEPRDS